MKQKTSIDLFSGVGGMQLALKDVCRPLLYCEIDPACQRVLRERMRDGSLPSAPIVPDVRDVGAIMRTIGKRRVDVVVATPSCKGFSVLNDVAPGLKHAETHLFVVVLRLVERIRPSWVFLENVPGIVTANAGKDLRYLLQRFGAMGYTGGQSVFAASDIGAPHHRRRWYALLKKDGVAPPRQLRTPDDVIRAIGRPWPPRLPSPHLIPKNRDADRYAADKARLMMMGNAVVPPCARFAFLCLLCNWDDGAGVVATKERAKRALRRPLDLVLDPKVAEGKRHAGAVQPAVPGKVRRSFFPTPRYGKPTGCNVLIRRCIGDLGAFVRFWRDATGDRFGIVNPRFAEHMMGFPQGWTAVSTRS